MVNKLKWAVISLYDYIKFLLFAFSIPRNSKLIVVVCHNGSLNGGASIVLNELLDHMDIRNYKVVVLCKNGGDLIKNSNYNYFVYQYIPKLYFFILKRFPLQAILVNTIICCSVINIIQNKYNCPIVWWIHEDRDLFDKMKQKLPSEINSRVKVLCVSRTSQEAFLKFYPNNKSSILHYGIRDYYTDKEKNNDKLGQSGLFRIGVVGMLCDRKNQMQIIHLMKKLPHNIVSRVQFIVIAGTYDKKYKEKFLLDAKNFKQIKFIPGVSHEKIIQLYSKINLLLCCSKYDPLPVVVTEAMMMECLCLVSSGCGQYHYIVDGKNGYKYDVNNISMLSEKLSFIIRTNDSMLSVLKNERELYKKEFSMTQTVEKMSSYLNLK